MLIEIVEQTTALAFVQQCSRNQIVPLKSIGPITDEGTAHHD